MEHKTPLAKEGQREVSSFIGGQMLFDYYEGRLDKERRSAVEEHLRYSGDAQSELEKLRSADDFAKLLSSIQIKSETKTILAQPKSYFQILQAKFNFSNWVTGLKWGVEALMFVSVVIALFSLAPWETIIKRSLDQKFERIVLTEVPRPPRNIEPMSTNSEFVDEGLVKTATKQSAPNYAFDVRSYTPPPGFIPEQAIKISSMPSKPATSADLGGVHTSETPIVPNQKPIPTPKAGKTTEAQVATSNLDSLGTIGGGGFLFRGDLPITNLAAVGGKIKEKIENLGGRKAGEVELGWQKAKDRSYFHFTMPAAKYAELDQFLRGYGKLKIAKEKHPRIMPDGIVRIILEVSEKSP